MNRDGGEIEAVMNRGGSGIEAKSIFVCKILGANTLFDLRDI